MDARLTPAQRRFYYEQHHRRQRELVDDQILAILLGVGHLFSESGTPPFLSDRNRQLFDEQAKHSRTFPYDVPYLRTKDVQQLVKHNQKYQLSVWTPERAQAHLQHDNMVAKRASVSPFLWGKYQEYRKLKVLMDLVTLKKWADVEKYEEILQDKNARAPSHLQYTAKEKGLTPQGYWDQVLQQKGVNKEQLRQAHWKLVEELAKDLQQQGK